MEKDEKTIKESVDSSAIVPVETSEEISIDKSNEELVKSIIKAKSKQELESLYQEFALNNTKKEAARINQLNGLLDQVNKEAINRFTNRPAEVSNKEILDYMNAVQNQIERSKKTVDGIKEVNAVQVNNTQNIDTVNIHVGNKEVISMSKESRERINDFISSVLKETNKNIVLDMSDDGTTEIETPTDHDEQVI